MFTSAMIGTSRQKHRGRKWLRNRAKTESPKTRPENPASAKGSKVFPGWMDDLIREMESDYMLLGKELSFR